jgi:hypothetical protein
MRGMVQKRAAGRCRNHPPGHIATFEELGTVQKLGGGKLFGGLFG